MLEGVRCRIGATGEEVRRAIDHLFLFIGAEPNTNWLKDSGISLDTVEIKANSAPLVRPSMSSN